MGFVQVENKSYWFIMVIEVSGALFGLKSQFYNVSQFYDFRF